MMRGEMYRYEISTGKWSIVEIPGERADPALGHGLCAYKDSLYVLFGFNPITSAHFEFINRLKVDDNEVQSWKAYEIGKNVMPLVAFGFVCSDNFIYLYGGLVKTRFTNELFRIDLSSPTLEWVSLSRKVNSPTARYAHAMEVYDDKLFILGGVDKNGNK